MQITEAKIIEALDKYDHLNKKYGPIGENRNVVIEMLLGEKKEFQELESPVEIQSGVLPDKNVLIIPLQFTIKYLDVLEMVKKLDDDVDALLKLGFEIRK